MLFSIKRAQTSTMQTFVYTHKLIFCVLPGVYLICMIFFSNLFAFLILSLQSVSSKAIRCTPAVALCLLKCRMQCEGNSNKWLHILCLHSNQIVVEFRKFFISISYAHSLFNSHHIHLSCVHVCVCVGWCVCRVVQFA